jgi:hypothetical protein
MPPGRTARVSAFPNSRGLLFVAPGLASHFFGAPARDPPERDLPERGPAPNAPGFLHSGRPPGPAGPAGLGPASKPRFWNVASFRPNFTPSGPFLGKARAARALASAGTKGLAVEGVKSEGPKSAALNPAAPRARTSGSRTSNSGARTEAGRTDSCAVTPLPRSTAARSCSTSSGSKFRCFPGCTSNVNGP